MTTKTTHKWANEIKAWADGEKIECRHMPSDSMWGVWVGSPIDWNDDEYEFRVMKDPVIIRKYFRLVFSLDKSISYVEFEPDLERWDLCITYKDGEISRVRTPDHALVPEV